MKKLVFVFLLLILLAPSVGLSAAESTAITAAKKILIIYENGPAPANGGLGDARQLRQLMGHFKTDVTLLEEKDYKQKQISGYDFIFYIGYSRKHSPTHDFMKDAYATGIPLIWINTGMEAFADSFDTAKQFGFIYQKFDTTSVYDLVTCGAKTFTKTEPNANVIKVTDPALCTVLASATSSSTKTVIPYIIKSRNFYYVADSPFSYATEADRYLLFADMLHDILGEQHPESHSAIIRIEDTNPFSDPEKLRKVADILYDRNIPFLVGVTPFYVNPASGIRVSMSDKPDYVDALHYMMEHGGTIVMHGTTHQYKGETSVDYEYWDESRDSVIPVDSREYVNKKISEGINEFIKNGVYPLVWETPHYSASSLDYSVFAEHFTTAVEQRLVLERLDESQFFPYIIFRDMYNQKIYPENLGYIPQDPDIDKERESVDRLISFAKANLSVRDGFASAFFHPFLEPELLERLVDGIEGLGYKFIDLREDTNIVRTDDRIIVSGNANISLNMDEEYLRETVINDEAEITSRTITPNRIKGLTKKEVRLNPKWIYAAEATEYYERTLTFWEKTRYQIAGFIQKNIRTKKTSSPANVLLLYDFNATGGAYRDQLSFESLFRSLNIPLDKMEINPQTKIKTEGYNLCIIPYNVADQLSDKQINALKEYVQHGGNIITDFRNTLAAELGINFLESTIQIDRVRDAMYPEEPLKWRRSEVMNRFETMRYDEIMNNDDKTDTPVVIGRNFGDGKFIFFGTRFDPVSTEGFSRYPYLIQHIGHFFSLNPLLRRDELEMYFDPGFRHTVSIEQLVSRWVANGIRIIHVAGWHEYPKYKYDYEKLIKLAHSNGILVYAWLEPPQVSQKFWLDHPEWREKNYKNEDIRPSWRYPVALTDDGCLNASIKYYRDFLNSYDWDGVNIAELYLESGHDFKDMRLMTPFHPSARAEFRKEYGFDPLDIYDQNSPKWWEHNQKALSSFVEYRVKTVVRLHDAMLGMAESIRKGKPGFQIIVTAVDNLSAPEIRTNNGVDINEIYELTKKYPFTLQVEDPQSMWSLDPGRYEKIADRYKKFVDPDGLALDLNILSFRKDSDITPFPTNIQTGTECFSLVNSAAKGANHVTIYSESSMNAQDISYLANAYSARSNVLKAGNGWTIDTPTTLVLQLSSDINEIWRNDKPVLSIGDGRFLLPVGSYHIRVSPESIKAFEPDILKTRLLSITGDLLSLKSSQRSVTFKYKSDSRCIVTLVKKPYALFIDGHETDFTPLEGNGRFALMLPPGKHEAVIVAQSTVSYNVDITSFWSSSIIVLFGIVAGGLLLIFYISVRIRQRSIQE